MATDFDPGYGLEPFATLCREYPDDSVYPGSDFRVEWGPIFHRGRLDGSARVLVIGQDPAQHEAIARRILIGEAGHRLQGFLSKLGIDRSYVLVNTFLYSLYGATGPQHADDAPIAEYRGRWLKAIFDSAPIEAVVSLGTLADHAWHTWKATPDGAAVDPGYVHITHPTQPESAAGNNAAKHKQLITAMLRNWNHGLDAIAPRIAHPDAQRPLTHYGDAFAAGDRIAIPPGDLPAGLPAWVGADDGWAARGTGATRRATITVTVPRDSMP